MTAHRRLIEPILILVLAESAELIVFAGGGGLFRLLFGLTFALLVPGWAVLRLMRLETDPLTWLSLAVAISSAIDIAVALPLFYLDIWSVQFAVTALLGITVTLVAIDLPVVRRRLGQG